MLTLQIGVVLLLSAGANAQVLAAKRFDYNNLPEKADTATGGERGPQIGTNRCGTGSSQDSLCQTALINSIDDFCLWGPPEVGQEVGSIEGQMVAWCTKPGRGTRVIPPGTLKGVQFMRTPNYVQVVGILDQTKINVLAGDSGGEMDPHGADQRGNPLGGLVFSNAWGQSSSGSAFRQSINWHNFLGSNVFCFKSCSPDYGYDYRMCEHVYDRSGCNVNAPADYKEGVFESCLGDDQLPPGVYVENGVTSTWTQPPEGTPVGELPYVPFIPPSSRCTPYQSAAIYNGQPVGNAAGPVATSMPSSAMSGSASASNSGVSASSSMSSAVSSQISDSSSMMSSSSMVESSMQMSSSSVASSSVMMSSQTSESSSAAPTSTTLIAPVVTQIISTTGDPTASAANASPSTTSSAGRVLVGSCMAVSVGLMAFFV